MIAMLIKKMKKFLNNNSPKIPQADREHGGMTVFKKTTEMYIFIEFIWNFQGWHNFFKTKLYKIKTGNNLKNR